MWSLKPYGPRVMWVKLYPLQGVRIIRITLLSVMSMLLSICSSRRVAKVGYVVWLDEMAGFEMVHFIVMFMRLFHLRLYASQWLPSRKVYVVKFRCSHIGVKVACACEFT